MTEAEFSEEFLKNLPFGYSIKDAYMLLRDWLRLEGIRFGDPEYIWDEEAAEELSWRLTEGNTILP